MTPSSLIQNVPILKLNTLTVTNRIYSTEEIEKTIKKIDPEGISGTLGRPFPNTENQGPDDYIHIPVEKISHIAHTFRIEEDTLVCDITFLTTQLADIVKQFYLSNKATFVPVGICQIRKDKDNNNIDYPYDYTLLQVNCVSI